MRILVLNSGSSTLKLDVLEVEGGAEPIRLAHGAVDRINTPDAALTLTSDGHEIEVPAGAQGYADAFVRALDVLKVRGLADIDALGHRVVHGGSRFIAPTLITPDMVSALDGLTPLAPLHNPPALEVIRAAGDALGDGVPMVAVFDTAFHSSLLPAAYTYAIPHEVASRHNIRRYGFHGIAHQYMLERYCHLTGTAPERATIITLQLGNGCSACAILDGKSFDTSMGFTPLEGLVMGTRSGDIDPGILGYLYENEHLSAPEVVNLLNKRSGLLGISNSTSDMRTLLENRDQDPLADLAIEVFCYRVRKYIGAYLAALGGVQAIVFGGGIGEHAPYIRKRILQPLEWLNLRVDHALNDAATNDEACITTSGSALAAYTIPVDESLLIARQTYQTLVS